MACYLIVATAALCAGFVIDLAVGDPRGWPHLVRGMGALISCFEKALYHFPNKRRNGAWMAALTLIICTALPVVILVLAFRISPWLYFVVETVLCWQVFSVKSLRVESGAVFSALQGGVSGFHDEAIGIPGASLYAARTALSMIVGRDTEGLDEAGITCAAVETVAENTSDGVIAPFFYLMLGGAPLGCLYKAANTMDSMVGYKNERYLDFGQCAAKIDDVLNFIPARLAAVLMIAASRFCRMDTKNAVTVWKRDRRKHASPNSAQTEAVAAGALRIRLAGGASYFGEWHEKPYIGDDLRPAEAEDIRRSHRLLYVTAVLMMVVCLAERGVLYALACGIAPG
ncbi:cobalamin biosynthesis protein CobD [Clostridia bacterium]|nr:cobalamin biosynthesis protein CobD [Clostridia bacterium]